MSTGKVEYLENNYKELAKCVQAFQGCLGEVAAAADLILDRLEAGAVVYACGNGGSATDAMHLCQELVGRYRDDRKSLPAVSLCTDGSVLTCIGNDYGFEEIFSRQVAALGRSGDVLVGFSTSGNSENVVRAFQVARRLGMHTILLSGKTGGALKSLSEISVLVPSENTARIQELHAFVLHAWLERVENHYLDGKTDG